MLVAFLAGPYSPLCAFCLCVGLLPVQLYSTSKFYVKYKSSNICNLIGWSTITTCIISLMCSKYLHWPKELYFTQCHGLTLQHRQCVIFVKFTHSSYLFAIKLANQVVSSNIALLNYKERALKFVYPKRNGTRFFANSKGCIEKKCQKLLNSYIIGLSPD